MGSAETMVARAEQDIGLTEPNYIQEWYADRNGSEYNFNFAWCDAAITRWAYDSGNYDAVNFGTDYAYTVSHAARAENEGAWHYGTSGIRRGDIAFLDWNGGNSISVIDHVEVVTGTGSGVIYSIGGNIGDKCDRHTYSKSLVVGYIRPDYDGTDSIANLGDELIGLKRGDKGEQVKALQVCLKMCGFNIGSYGVDGDYGKDTSAAVYAMRKKNSSKAKSDWGDEITGWAYAYLIREMAKAH